MIATSNLLTVGPQHTLAEAARKMNDRNVGSAVVCTEDGCPGIITERDLLRAMAEGVDPDSAVVEDYMTATAITASESWDVAEAAARMLRGRFRHLLVIGVDGEVAGVLSIRDLVASLLREPARVVTTTGA